MSVNAILNSTIYLNIIADHVHSFMAVIFSGEDGHIQQDNAPFHRALSVLNWFEEHQSEFSMFLWTAQFPDFNPIEHLLDEVKRTLG